MDTFAPTSASAIIRPHRRLIRRRRAFLHFYVTRNVSASQQALVRIGQPGALQKTQPTHPGFTAMDTMASLGRIPGQNPTTSSL